MANFQQVLLGFTACPNLGFEELIEANGLVQQEMDEQANNLWGTTIDETKGEEFRIMIFASGRKYEKPSWAKTIFSQVENMNMNLELEKLAREMNWTVEQGEAFTPDLVAFSYFISIVDSPNSTSKCNG